MPNHVEARDLRPILEVAAELGLSAGDLELYGRYKAKLDHLACGRGAAAGRLILVTALNPTPAGEGKTTVAIGLADAMRRLGRRVCLCLRQPSLGPVFGVKGGATGGGRARVVPSTDINLHFTGDFHAVTAAHNLLSALVDNHLHHGNPLGLDPRAITWPRAMDMNDRALRQVVVGLGGAAGGVPREDRFVITPASEVMAILGLAGDLADLRDRLGRIIVGLNREKQPVRAADLQAAGAMAALLRDAFRPNLVQTLEGTPALIHTGPFGNIAHGTSSVAATRAALGLAEYVVQEAGFGADLGAEKFVHIVCRGAGFRPAAAVVVATVRALKYHGGAALAELERPDPAALERGLANLDKHLENVREVFGIPAVVAVNRFAADTDVELARIGEWAGARGVPAAVADIFARGGEGGIDLARAVVAVAEGAGAPVPAGAPAEPGSGAGGRLPGSGNGGLRFVYDLDAPLAVKIEQVARRVYGAGRVEFTKAAERGLRRLARWGMDRVPVCMAKTQYSLSDDPERRGRPEGFTLTVREVIPAAGAGFVVVLTGEVMTMPGLPQAPAAARIDVGPDGEIVGV